MKRKRKIIIVTAIIAVFSVAVYLLIDGGIGPNIAALGSAQLKNAGTLILNKSVSQTLVEVGDIGDLLQVEKDSSGKITLLRADSLKLNTIANVVSTKAQEMLTDVAPGVIKIPLGNAFGSDLFSGIGPLIHVNAQNAGSVATEFLSEFTSGGINQTRYKIYIVLSAKMIMVVGSRSHSVEVTSQVLISESILVGDVPNVFAELSGANMLIP